MADETYLTETDIQEAEEAEAARGGVVGSAFGDQSVTFEGGDAQASRIARMKRQVRGMTTRYLASKKGV